MDQLRIRKRFRLQAALSAAAEAVKNMSGKEAHDSGITELERVHARDLLMRAWSAIEVSNRLCDVPTRSLFPKYNDEALQARIGMFFREHLELRMLADFAESSWDEIKFLFRKNNIPCPLSLQKFHIAYREHMERLERAAAPTNPAPLA